MGIVRFDPFREMDRLQNEVNRLFEGYLNVPERGGAMAQGSRVWSPLVDILESQNEIILRAEIPGMKQEEIDIELSGDTLTLRGERKFEQEERRDNLVRVERSYGRFQRSFTLGVPIQHDKVAANYRDGILEVHLPKSEATRPRKVQVQHHGQIPGQHMATPSVATTATSGEEGHVATGTDGHNAHEAQHNADTGAGVTGAGTPS